RGRPGAVRGRHGPPGRGGPLPQRRGGAHAGEQPADPRGALPPPLRRRAGGRPAHRRGAGRGGTPRQGPGPVPRLIVARARVRLLAWIGGIVLLVYVTAVSTVGIYPTQ